MASEENHTIYEDDEESEEEEDDLTLPHEDEDDDVDDEDDDVLGEEEDLNSASSADPLPPPIAAAATKTTGGVTINSSGGVTIAVPPPPVTTELNPDIKPTISTVQEEKKQQPLDESRRLFQRLWTDEDEIELLQGFLEYTTQRGTSQHHHHDTALFYDQIKCKLQLDFNKNQLVEKLRRLKKKYRNVVNRISSGKDFSFKSPHDQATFEISRKIWSNTGGIGVTVAEDTGLDDEEPNPNPNPNPNLNSNATFINNDGVDANNSLEKKSQQRSRKRSRVKIEEKRGGALNDQNVSPPVAVSSASMPSMIEETVRSCLSPLFKELLNNAMNGSCGPRGFGGMGMLNPMPLSFGGPSGAANLFGGEMADERWRKQQILELEVYSKRLELVQDQIKVALEELRSMGS